MDDVTQKDSMEKKALMDADPRAVKTWRVVNKPNAAAAVVFLNAGPAQQAGEAFVGLGPNGTVDVYAFF